MNKVSFLFGLAIMFTTAKGLTFTYSFTDDAGRPSPIDLLIFQNAFEKEGYYPISANLKKSNNYLIADQIFVNLKNSMRIFLKIGLKTSKKSLNKKIIPIANGLIYHSKINDTHYALYFENFDTLSLKKVTLSVEEAFTPKHGTAFFRSLFIPRAYASSHICTSAESNIDIMRDLNSSVASLNLLPMLQDCIVGALQGARDSAIAIATGATQTINQLLTNPQELWRETSERFRHLREATMTIHTSIAQAIQNFEGIPPEIMKPLMCGMVGAMAPSLLRAMTPTGASSLAVLAVKATDKLSKLVGNLKKVLTRAPRGTNGAVWAQRVGSCAIH